jgi:hypothetical protein
LAAANGTAISPAVARPKRSHGPRLVSSQSPTASGPTSALCLVKKASAKASAAPSSAGQTGRQRASASPISVSASAGRSGLKNVLQT